jgi:hypothetical protein
MNSQTTASDNLIAGVGDGEPDYENRALPTDQAPAKTLVQKLLNVTIVLLFVSATISWIGFLGWAAWRLLNVNP